ncbi:MAG TPA: quinolinate synthase NadA [Candidatus Hydrogenedentes bacterium]|nr:quinolinate synthase NadA [Candidatus Hydrogenedentota bacterium]
MSETAMVKEADSVEETYQRMKAKLEGVVPDFELQLKAELAFQINQLKRERNAVILGHNYMEPALYHSVPDYVGDSLQLSRISAETDADIIVFCGVKFMAETAKVLNPGKIVLIPDQQAGCSLAEGVSVEDVRALKERYPGVPVVTYVNTYADVKAESDYCCTSGNADKVIAHIMAQGYKKVIFLPDEFLARNTAREMGIPFVLSSLCGGDDSALVNLDQAVIGWKARCEVHEKFTVDDVLNARKQFPDVVILAHPECPPEVIELCDVSGSTKAMVDYVRDIDAPRYLLLTECSMGDNLAAEFPNREMVRLCSLRCEDMALITLEATLEALQKTQYQIEIAEDIIQRARLPIDRMIAIR